MDPTPKKPKKLPPRAESAIRAYLDAGGETDPLGMYTGCPTVDSYNKQGEYRGQVHVEDEAPVQDVDDL